MLKFYMIPDKEKFLRHVQQSTGDVFLNLPDGTQCSLKSDTTAINFLRMMDVGKDGIDLSFAQDTDMPRFMQYMMEAAKSA